MAIGSDDNRVKSGQILSDSVEFRRNPSRIPTERNPTTGYRIRSTLYGKCRIPIGFTGRIESPGQSTTNKEKRT